MAATRQCCVVVLLLALCCVWTEAVGDPVIDLSRRVLNTRSTLLLFLVHARMTTNIHCYAAHTAADTSCAHIYEVRAVRYYANRAASSVNCS